MRICHVSPHLPPDQAANALLPAELAAWNAASGHEVSFVTQPPAQGGQSTSSLPGPVAHVAARSSSKLLRLSRLDTLRRARSIGDALDRVAAEATLLHLHSNGLIVEVAAAWARRRKIPFVLPLYGTEIWHYSRRWPVDPFTRAYMHAQAVTFYSQRLLERALALGLRRPNLSTVYPAVSGAFQPADDETRAAWRQSLGIAEPHVVLNVKRLHPLAAQSDLLKAFARVAGTRADVRLVICGTGPLAAALQQEATALGIAEKVTFAGLVPNAEVARFAAIADVFVLPSKLEALPTVAVEALAAGTPVVSADHPGGLELHALFGDDVHVVPGGDITALAKAIYARVSVPRRTLVGTSVLVDRNFGPAAVYSAYEALYRQAIL